MEVSAIKCINVSVVLFETKLCDLRQLFESLLLSNNLAEVFCIDHSPGTACRSIVEEYGFIYIHRPNNPGYGAGHNLGISRSIKSCAFLHLVVNPDVVIHGGSLDTMLSIFREEPSLGLCVPRITDSEGNLAYACKLLPRPLDLIKRIPFVNKFFNEDHRYDLRFSGYDNEMWAPYYSGSFMLFRVSALADIGLFDERFFMYPEDIDISRRIVRKYKSLFTPRASITHAHAAESKKNLYMFVVHAWNMVRYFNKWGWFWDPERSFLNEACLAQFKEKD